MWGAKIVLKTFSLAGAIAILALAVDIAALAARLTNWQFDPSLNQLEVTVDEGTTPRYFLLTQPPRIVLDLPDTELGSVETQQSYTGLVRQIRVSRFQAGVTRIVMDLSPEVVLTPQQVQLQQVGGDALQGRPLEGVRWVLRPLISGVQTAAPEGSTLPPANFFGSDRAGVVSVPPLNPTSTGSNLPTGTLPPARFSPNSNVSVSVPPLQRETAPTPLRESQTSVTRVVEFGQPLPTPKTASPVRESRTEESSNLPSLEIDAGAPVQRRLAYVNPNVMLPSGSELILRYPGDKILKLQAGSSRQEVLLLQEEILDKAGNIIFPTGTQVIGRFESDRSGSRFIAQAISLGGRNIRLTARSPLLRRARQVPENSIVPNQILQVKLTKDLR